MALPGTETAAGAEDYIDSMNERPNIPSIGACPICGKPVVQKYRPFCGKRCADVDLGRWLNAAYVVPGKDEEDGNRQEASTWASCGSPAIQLGMS